jgi:5-methyltetrahydrofolate--homocysteine methyltransferase
MNLLKPHLADEDVSTMGKVVIGTVAGDLHDIGKNLVGMMLEGSGFEVIDLQTDVSPQSFVDAVREHQPQMVGMSALLTTTMPSMGATIEALKEAGLRDQVKVMIGGAPITQDFAEKIGADGFAPDASSATRKAKALLGVT